MQSASISTRRQRLCSQCKHPSSSSVHSKHSFTQQHQLTLIESLGVTDFIHFWHAPLRVRSAKRRHQSPGRAILSQVDCFIQGEVNWFQVLLDSLHPRGARASWWSPPVLQGEAVKIFFAYGKHAMWPNRERRRAWTMAERVIARLSVLHHHSTHGGTIWFPTAYADTIAVLQYFQL